jgi:hypothetical protein
MSVLAMATADTQDTGLVTVVGTCVVTSDQARTGTYSYKCSGGGQVNAMQLAFTAQTSGYLRWASMWGTVTSSHGEYLRFYDSDGSTVNLSIYWNGIDQWVRIYRGALDTLLAESTGVPVGGDEEQFNVWEFYWNIHDSTGAATLKLNGGTLLNFSGDTSNGGNADVARIAWAPGTSFSLNYVDDVIIRTDDWPGRGGIYVLSPDAGSSLENWTASAGNPEDCVDELPVSFTDYISTDAAVAGTQHLVGAAALPVTSEAINAVGVAVKILTDDSAPGDALTLLKAGSTTDQGSSTGVTGTGAWIATYYLTNPDDAAAWEDADVNAVEIGVESG